MVKKVTAEYRVLAEQDGCRYSFLCAVTGAQFRTEGCYRAEDPEQQALLAWEAEGRGHFNQCRKCGRWVFDIAFNPEVLECIACAPFEAQARFCKTCGARVPPHGRTCPTCGKALYYEGVDA